MRRPERRSSAPPFAGAGSPAEPIRLQKWMAHAGVASRRRAEDLIGQGRVRINGEVVDRPGTTVRPGRDVVEVDGQVVARPEELVYYLLNKPPGYVSTVRDPHHRSTVVALLKGVSERVYPVGRLDEDSEGLLLLTNDGELAHRLTHPRFQVEKEYLVDVVGEVRDDELGRIRGGVLSRGEHLAPKRLTIVSRQAGRTRVAMVLTEGKKREIRRMFEAVSRPVERLRRVRLGPLELGDLPPGHFRSLDKKEVDQLRAATSD
ncbi:MAG: pseudouridine synthase [Chloroflexota bacterium]